MDMVPVLQLVMPQNSAGFAWHPLTDFEKLPLSSLSAAALMLERMIQDRLVAAMKLTQPLHGPEASMSEQLAEELRRRRDGVLRDGA